MGNYASTWIGIGFKIGGQFIAAGIDSFCGAVMSPYHSAIYEVYVTNMRVGLGLGGGASVAFVFLLDCPKPIVLNGRSCSDWGVGLALGNNWGGFIKTSKDTLKSIKALEPMIKRRQALIESGNNVGHFVKGLNGAEIEAVKTATGQIMGAYDSCSNANSSPKLLVIDSPFPGTNFGVELSLYLSGGKIEVQ